MAHHSINNDNEDFVVTVEGRIHKEYVGGNQDVAHLGLSMEWVSLISPFTMCLFSSLYVNSHSTMCLSSSLYVNSHSTVSL